MTIHLSCGHVAEDGCLGVPVEFQDEQCVAGEGFVPCTVEAVYCHKCAMDLAAAEERAKIVAWLRETQEAIIREAAATEERAKIVAWLRERDGFNDYYSELKDQWLSDRIARGEHLK